MKNISKFIKHFKNLIQNIYSLIHFVDTDIKLFFLAKISTTFWITVQFESAEKSITLPDVSCWMTKVFIWYMNYRFRSISKKITKYFNVIIDNMPKPRYFQRKPKILFDK